MKATHGLVVGFYICESAFVFFLKEILGGESVWRCIQGVETGWRQASAMLMVGLPFYTYNPTRERSGLETSGYSANGMRIVYRAIRLLVLDFLVAMFCPGVVAFSGVWESRAYSEFFTTLLFRMTAASTWEERFHDN